MKDTAGRADPAKRPHPSSRSRPRPRASGTATPVTPDRLDLRELLQIYRPDLAQVLREASAPSYRYSQVFEHLFRPQPVPFKDSTVLPHTLRTALDRLGSSSLTVSGSRTSSDRTTKLLLTAADGAAIEMVIMRYRSRVTVCISSQVGCPVGCAFCASGRGGMERNLSAAEIVDQVRLASAVGFEEGWRLSNLVYMGMGEPLLNLQAVLASIQVLTSPQGLHLGHRSISVSTVGIPSGIRRLARSEPQVNLALSLHAADDRTRAQLVPPRFHHPLAELLAAAWDHFEITHRKLLVEYVLLEGVNDSSADARRLAALLRGHVVTVNLLAWNPVAGGAGTPNGAVSRSQAGSAASPGGTGRRQRGARSAPGATSAAEFAPSSPAAATAFRDALAAAGVEAVIRQSKGSGIDAACGQLAGRARSGKRTRKNAATTMS